MRYLFIISVLLLFAGISNGQTNITVTSPNGGEIWEVGHEYAITWQSHEIGDRVKIKLKRTTSSGRGGWYSIADNAPNDGNFVYNVPSTLPQENQTYKVFVMSLDETIQDGSNGLFQIKDLSVKTPSYKTVSTKKQADRITAQKNPTQDRIERKPDKNGIFWSVPTEDHVTVLEPVIYQKRTPIKPVQQRFKYIDPQTKRAIPPNTILNIPVGEDSYVQMSAKDYFDQLNELEQKLNAQGYSLDINKDPETLYKIPMDAGILQKLQDQERRIIKIQQDKADTIKNRKIKGTYRPFKTAVAMKEDFDLVSEMYPKRIERLRKIFPKPPKITPYSLSNTNVYINEFNEEAGDRSLFGISYIGYQQLSGKKSTGINVIASGDYGVYIFGSPLPGLKFDSKIRAPVSGEMGVNLNIWNKDGSKDKHVDITDNVKIEEAGSVHNVRSYGIQMAFMVGIFEVVAEAGVNFSSTLNYSLLAEPLNASQTITPDVGAEAYLRGGIKLLIVGVGHYCNLNLMKIKTDVRNHAYVTDDLPRFGNENHYVFDYGTTGNLNALSGEAGIYVELDLIFYSKRWYLELFNWNGFTISGYLGDVPPKKVYCPVETPDACTEIISNMRAMIPPNDWKPVKGSMYIPPMTKQSHLTIAPSMAAYGDEMIHVYPYLMENEQSIYYLRLRSHALDFDKVREEYWMDYLESMKKIPIPPGTGISKQEVEVITYLEDFYVFFTEYYFGKRFISYLYMNENGKWSPVNPGKHPRIESNENFSLTVYDNKLYLFYLKPNDDRIWYRIGSQEFAYVGSLTWGKEEFIQGSSTDQYPSACSFKDAKGDESLYVFYKQKGGNRIFYSIIASKSVGNTGAISSAVGGDISKHLINGQSPHAPEVVIFDRDLYVFYKGGNPNNIYYQLMDSYGQWSGQKPITSKNTSGSVFENTQTNGKISLCATNNTLLLSHVHSRGTGILARWLSMPPGVVLYNNKEYKDPSDIKYIDVRYEPDLDVRYEPDRLSFDNVTESIRIPEGYRVSLFEHKNYSGKLTILEGNAINLDRFDIGANKVSSIKVSYDESAQGITERSVRLYSGQNFTDQVLSLPLPGTLGEFNVLPEPWGSFKSMTVPEGCIVERYQKPYFNGRWDTYRGNSSNLLRGSVVGPWTGSIKVVCDDQ